MIQASNRYNRKVSFNFVLFHFADFTLETVSTRFARMIAEYSSFQAKVKQRLSKLEKLSEPEPEIEEAKII